MPTPVASEPRFALGTSYAHKELPLTVSSATEENGELFTVVVVDVAVAFAAAVMNAVAAAEVTGVVSVAPYLYAILLVLLPPVNSGMTASLSFTTNTPSSE